MGAFDDLIPKQSASGGAFDDLIPQAQPSQGILDTAGQVVKNLGGAVGDLTAGMVDPIIGAGQFVSNLVGAGEPVNKAVANYEQWLKSRGTDEGIRTAGQILGTLPAATAAPIFQGAQGALPIALQAAKNIGVGAGVGGAMGATTPITDTSEQTYGDQVTSNIGTGAAIGGAISGIAPPLLKGAGMVTGGLVDAIRGRLPTLQAAKAVRSTLPDEASARAALDAAPNSITAAQALQEAGIYSPGAQALGVRAVAGDPTSYGARFAQQESDRLDMLRRATPDQAASEAARTAGAAPLYAAATAPGNLANTTPIIAEIDSILRRQGSNPELAAAMTRLRNSLVGPTGKPYANAERVASALDGLKASIANKDNKFIVGQLTGLKDDLARSIPGYQAAQQEFARLSAPVNQAKVLTEMDQVLQRPGGGERVTPFLNVMGRGESALLKRADQSPRFNNGLSDVLDPTQMRTVGKIASEMERDLQMKDAAKLGRESATKALQDVRLSSRLPAFFDKWITALNQGLATTEERIGVKTLAALTEGMKTGKSLNKMLMELPTVERNAVLKSMMKFDRAAPVVGAATVQASQ